MIGVLYTVAIGSQAQTTAKTLIVLTAGSNTVTMIERLWLKQTNFDTSENLGVKLQRASVAGTSTATVPEPLDPDGSVYGGTGGTNSTVDPTYTAGTEIIEDGFNVLSGYLWTPANDDEIIVVPGAGIIGFHLDVAPLATMDFSYGATIREIG